MYSYSEIKLHMLLEISVLEPNKHKTEQQMKEMINTMGEMEHFFIQLKNQSGVFNELEFIKLNQIAITQRIN